jgi:hypothetical protein
MLENTVHRCISRCIFVGYVIYCLFFLLVLMKDVNVSILNKSLRTYCGILHFKWPREGRKKTNILCTYAAHHCRYFFIQLKYK